VIRRHLDREVNRATFEKTLVASKVWIGFREAADPTGGRRHTWALGGIWSEC
jgi:hypothetical protein